ncbi:triadin-like isoform X1 [Syngnathus typhle]|uniref:triadin-like isoform X1 n=1 Tax=Syngnathus typhle TaxID=161592 RepID=UPI002A6AFF96|nr:triadin-like isoform X1 [Syngnathus typhle]XP_061126060.1 triadin-like isoform X1 [Syngnathus typhle]XP_061126061.1 triadin-like isoform X1 [Syngnathus typhle]
MVIAERQASSKSKAPMSGRHKSIVDDLVLTFSSPAGWLLAAALVVTWAAVAVLVFDLLDDKTLAEYTSYCDDPVCFSPGLPPPSPAAGVTRRGLKVNRGRPIRTSAATPPQDESPDWLEVMWTFAAGLVAPDDEDEAEGIHRLTKTFTPLHSEEF